MTAVPASLCCTLLLFTCVFAGNQEIVTAESGQTVTLPCRAPNSNNDPEAVVEWSRADLGTEYVLLYQDGHFDRYKQHQSFNNRVDLQDRQMKDGDVSLILKNVTINDTGTYECRVREKGRSRAVLGSAPISIIYLRVDAPPGPTGGTTEDEEEEDGGKEDGDVGLIAGLSVSAGLLVLAAVVGILIHRKLKEQKSQTNEMKPV